MPPVASADPGKATHKSPSVKNSTESKNTKLCHIVKRADFDGYGFNLHFDKSKPGQVIGKIDANSPAEAAGLNEGDQILEVNGLPIGKETHRQVVQRIKAIAWEVKLLVLRETASEHSTKSQNKLANTKSTSSAKETKTNYEKKSVQDVKQLNSHAKPSTKTNIDALNSSVSAAKDINNGSPAKNHVISANSANPTTPPPPLTPPSPLKTAISLSAGSSTQKPDGTLKLPSTAAEMRAILQSKKKYNPKTDDVNLQKKYDIIQKL